MESEWPLLSLREAGIELLDCEHRTPPPAEKGFPYIAIPQIKQGRLDLTDVRYISHDHFIEWIKKTCPKPWDVILSRRCNPGETAFVPPNFKCALGQNLVILRSNGTRVIPEFLRWLVRGPYWNEQVQTYLNVGAVFDSLKCQDVPNFRLPIPPLPEQRAIAHILGTLDDKIELNRQMNETLEAMARAIFKSWFVDFDPVRAKAEGRDTGLPEEIAELFPDSFEETEVGEVPKGWKYCSAETVADVGIGKTPPRKESEWFSTNPDDIRWASIRDMGESGTYILDTTEYLTSEAVDKFNIRLVPNNTVLLSFKLTIGRVTLTDGEITTNEAIAHFKLYDEFHLSNEYLYLYLQKFDYTKLGSTSSIAQAVNSKTIKAMPILVPEESVITEFTGRFVSIFDKIKMNQRESRTLAELRDTLLPKLISGELRVNDLKINMEAMQ